MARIQSYHSRTEELAASEYSFTVVYDPVGDHDAIARGGKGKRSRLRLKNPLEKQGYRVTVPLLPGLITYGRTLEEAREMARDAIRCHLEGLRKAGEPIPDERKIRTEKLRIALSA